MQEKLLQNFWQWLNMPQKFKTISGLPVKIHNSGLLNHHQGPDFINAHITIAEKQYIGDIEIHYKSSGWINHHHFLDSWYKKVVLHVVWENDLEPRTLTLDYPPHTLQLSTFFNKTDLNKILKFPMPQLIKKLAEQRFKTKCAHYKYQNLKSRLPDLLFSSLWRACGFPHNQAAYANFAKWLFPFLENNHHHYTNQNLSLIVPYWLQAANLWKKFQHLSFFSIYQNQYSSPYLKHSRIKPAPLYWNMGKINPVNHPAVKIWQFAVLLTIKSWPEIQKSIIQIMEARLNYPEMENRLISIFKLPEPVNRIFHWHSKKRLIEWLMSAGIPMFFSHYSLQKAYGMADYLNELYYTLPAGYNYYKDQINRPLKFAYQYQGLLEWINSRKK